MADFLQYPQGDYVPKLVTCALEEARRYGSDIVTRATIPESARNRVRFNACEDGVICGIPLALSLIHI